MPCLYFNKKHAPEVVEAPPPQPPPEHFTVVLELGVQPQGPQQTQHGTFEPYPHKSGYYDLADRMALADGEVAIFRHFRSLNLLNLLRLQAEITNLEWKIGCQRLEDNDPDEKILVQTDDGKDVWVQLKDCCNSFLTMKKVSDQIKANQLAKKTVLQRGTQTDINDKDGGSNPGPDTASSNADGHSTSAGSSEEYSAIYGAQYDLIKEAGEKIREYNELLLQFRELSKISPPEQREMNTLSDWLAPSDHTDIVSFLRMPEVNAFNKTPEQYISLQPESTEANIIPVSVLEWYDRHIFRKRQARRREQGLWSDEERLAEIVTPGQTHYAKKSLIQAGDWLIPIVASLLLIGSVIALYFIPTTLKRLFATMPLTVVFSLLVTRLTSASRADVVAAVAAFVAVEVVFVGSVTPS